MAPAVNESIEVAVSDSKEPSVTTDVSAATGLPALSTLTERLMKPWRAH